LDSRPGEASGDLAVKLHPWNQGFAWTPALPPFRRIGPEQVRSWNERGCFVFEDAFDAASLAELLADFDPIEAKVTAFLRTQPGGRLFIADAEAITFSTHLVTRFASARRFCASPVFQDLCHDLVGPDARLYWDQAVYKKPESAKTFPWHQDNGYTYVEPQAYLTCWVALTDATLENGCPWLVPGLHRRGTLAHWMTPEGWACLPEDVQGEPVPARAGSVVVFSSLTPHRTGPNRTRAARKAYIVQYAPEGAAVLNGAAAVGSPERVPQTAPDRQFVVLRDGRPAGSEFGDLSV
jgi:ectoine hydroxylase-related dioxygenase (phytanoyl-CoA dioxygenase family)